MASWFVCTSPCRVKVSGVKMAVGAKLNQVWGGWGVANLGTETLLIMMTTYNDDDNYENYVEDDDNEENDVNARNGDDGVKV